jgi:hypothetical protein
VLLRREGFTVNHKRLFRLYREERLMVRRRGGRKRAMGTRAPMLVPQLPNERWSLDFVADQFNDGRRLRILVVVDDCPRMLGARSRLNDATWIADLMAHGLIRASFVPPAPIQELRDLTRTRKQLGREIVKHTQRIQKMLEDANTKLSSLIISPRAANRSPSHIEPVSGTPKRKLENGERRLALQSHQSRAESSSPAMRRGASPQASPSLLKRF